MSDGNGGDDGRGSDDCDDDDKVLISSSRLGWRSCFLKKKMKRKTTGKTDLRICESLSDAIR